MSVFPGCKLDGDRGSQLFTCIILYSLNIHLTFTYINLLNIIISTEYVQNKLTLWTQRTAKDRGSVLCHFFKLKKKNLWEWSLLSPIYWTWIKAGKLECRIQITCPGYCKQCYSEYWDTGKHPKCPSTDIMKYYSAIKRNKIGSFIVMWLDLDSII